MSLVTRTSNISMRPNVEWPVAGQKVHESWKNATKHSELISLVDSRVAVGVTGDDVDMDTALKALQTIDLGKLRSMAETK